MSARIEAAPPPARHWFDEAVDVYEQALEAGKGWRWAWARAEEEQEICEQDNANRFTW